MKDPITTPVAPREDWVIEKDQVIVEPQRPSQPPVTTGPGTIKAELPPTPTGVKNPPITSPGAVCSVMPRPEVPVVNWTGDAVLQVIATVRGGRVVGTDFRVAQGALDSKTKRSLQRSVESALSGYQCEGDATFQQDFAFRID